MRWQAKTPKPFASISKHKKRVAGEETGEYRDKEEDIPHVPVT